MVKFRGYGYWILSLFLFLGVISWVSYRLDFPGANIDESRFAKFDNWMRLHGYSGEIRDIYLCNFKNPILRKIMLDYFLIREGDLKHPGESLEGNRKFRERGPVEVNFAEVVPTDADASYAEVDQEMLEILARKLSNVFGREIKFAYSRLELNYRKELGDQVFDFNKMFPNGASAELDRLEGRFKQPCVIHFDLEYLQDAPVADIWNISHCAIFMGGSYRVMDYPQIIAAYAHELGHVFGLDHQFVDPLNSPRGMLKNDLVLQRFSGDFLGIDDIMIKSLPKNSLSGKMLSPLSRYVLEPEGGYRDADNMAKDYQAFFGRKVLKAAKASACAWGRPEGMAKNKECDSCGYGIQF